MDNYQLQNQLETVRVKKAITIWTVVGIILITAIVLTAMVGCPQYGVYTARKEGEAILAHARSSKEVSVTEAKAKMESASLLAQADTIRAHGVARSNIIIGESLSESYLHWYWIDNIEKNPQAVIYVPTEANIPIMEAGRHTEIPTK